MYDAGPSPSELLFYTRNSGTNAYQKNMMVSSQPGGELHGSWTVESNPSPGNILASSDRRLKKDIVPLQRTLRGIWGLSPEEIQAKERTRRPHTLGVAASSSSGLRRALGAGVAATAASTSAAAADVEDSPAAAQWLLRQLRPVSYRFRQGSESKHMRFGFVADELESVIPQVVRSMGDKKVKDQKAVVYQDLIALLFSSVQAQTTRIEAMEFHLKNVRRQLKEQDLI
jgi:hypothetical protein